MHLSTFERQIDSTILKRGQRYFRAGQVESLEWLDRGEYEAEVSGSETYQVFVKFEGERLVEHSCTCPYDWGPYCKHTVAVLYAIREEKHLEKEDPEAENPMAELLDDIPPQELREFILNYAKRHRRFRQDFWEIYG
jgi:uncharacterized Zn finger protein